MIYTNEFGGINYAGHNHKTNGAAVTIGNFDGVHKGHRRLIELTKEPGLMSLVLTFTPHPAFVFNANAEHKLITTETEKKRLMEELGVDIMVDYPFSKTFAEIPAEEFADDILFKQLCCKKIIIGEDYKFGKNRLGGVELLTRRAQHFGAEVVPVGIQTMDGEVISSTQIRKFLANGQIERANAFLGCAYFIMGTVRQGKKLGRTIGFPTINIVPDKDKLLPKRGVYLTKTEIGGVGYTSVTNVGVNPTVNAASSNEMFVETYVNGFDREIYGTTVRVSFYEYIRDEKKFDDVEELKKQLEEDIKRTLKVY